MKKILALFYILLSFHHLDAQCECTDCPITIPNVATVSSFMDISGANNNSLGVNGQELCLLCIELVYDAIQELDMVLISPSGDEIELMVNTGLAVNDNITFEICFVSCNESANPDSGFPAVFDTDAGYQPNGFYDGTYYPAVGCFEDLTGSVNGTWELEMTDNVILDNGDLLDWYMVFADDSGLGCANAGECGNSVSCLADGGSLPGPATINECEGDTNLDIDISPTWPGNPPPAADYDYTFIILDADTEIIEDITMDTDLTSYAPGTYQICGLSYLSDDASDIPSPDGSLEIGDIEDDIDDEAYCADLSMNCIEIIIDEVVSPPNFVGPLVVCAGEIEEWEITDYDPNLNYTITISSGSFSQFIFVDGIVTVQWTSGPGNMCANVISACGTQSTCLTIDVTSITPDYEILGNFELCPGETENYIIDPDPPSGASYIYSVTGGTIVNQGTSNVEIQWQSDPGQASICVELDGTSCDIDEVCEDVELELDYELPNSLDVPDELCLAQTAIIEVDDDPDVISYDWSVINATIISGEGTNLIEIEPDNTGSVEVCIQVETGCGLQGPICETFDALEIPEPEIINPALGCELDLILEVQVSNENNEFEWDDVTGPGEVNFDDAEAFLTDANFELPGLYELSFTESNDACETTILFEVEILANLLLTEPEFNCDLDFNYTVSFEILSGVAPYTVNGIEISGSLFVSEPIESGEDFEYEVIDALGCSALLEDEYECPCVSDAGSMDDDLLSVCISENQEIEAEWQEDGFLDNNDRGLFILHDNPDNELGEIFDINDTGVFEYFDELEPGRIYYISFVVGNSAGNTIDFDDPCLSVSIGQPVIFFDDPEITLEFNPVVCDGFVEIQGELDEEMRIEWQLVDGPAPVNFSDTESLPVQITFDSLGMYSFEYMLENEACTIFNELDISFAGSPSILLPSEFCDANAETYIIEFEVIGGEAPYTCNLPGSFNLNNFTSDPIPSGTPYQFTVIDANACESELFTGQRLCNCNTSSPVLESSITSVCGTTDSIRLDPLSIGFLDMNDTLIYYLHPEANFSRSSALDSSAVALFAFNSQFMFPDSLYYVTAVVGDRNSNGLDFSDPCLDISNTQALIWNSVPEIKLQEDSILCGTQFIFDALPANGTWSLGHDTDSNKLILSEIDNPGASVEVLSPGEYTFIWTSRKNSCTAADSFTITKPVSPGLSSFEQVCNDDLSTYNLIIDIVGNSPFSIDSDIFDNIYTIDNITAQDTFRLELLDKDGCEYELLFEPIDCSCQSDPGILESMAVNICIDDILNIDSLHSDFVVEPGDSIVFFIHDGSIDSIGSILEIFTNQLEYDPTIYEPGVSYFINSIVSPIANEFPNFDDVCTSLSNSLEISWEDITEISFIDNYLECIGNEVEVTLNSSIPKDLELIFINEINDTLSTSLRSDSTSLFFPVLDSVEIWNVEISANSCSMLIDSSLIIEASFPDNLVIIQDTVLCNNPAFGSSLLLSDLIVIGNSQGIWETGSIPLVNSQLEFENLDPGEYLISYSTIGLEDPCPGQEIEITITIEECPCPELQFQNISLCDTELTFELSNLDTENLSGFWSNSNVGGNTDILEISEDQVFLENSQPGIYRFTYTLDDNDIPTACQREFSFTLELSAAVNAGTQSDFPEFCSNDIQSVNLNTLIEGNTLGGEWIYNNNNVEEIIEINSLESGTNILSYIIESGSQVCPDDSTNIIIELHDPPEFGYQNEDVLCFGDENGILTLTDTLNFNNTWSLFLNDIEFVQTLNIENLGAGEYSLFIKSEFCRSETINFEILEPQPVSISLGEDRTILINDEVAIEAITNILESDVNTIDWFDLSGIIAQDVLEIRERFDENQEITVEISDTNGCIASDKLLVTVKLPGVYIPNIFSPNSINNNSFGIENIDVLERIVAFRIYDRWGNLVWNVEDESPSSSLTRWDGFFDNEPAEAGVYVYYFDVILADGQRQKFAGDLTLVR